MKGGKSIWAVLLLVLAARPGSANCINDLAPRGTNATESIRVATLNLAHGRKNGINQMLQSGAEARRNLSEIAGLLRDIDADVVALQEADAASAWSGGFDHVELLGDEAGYACRTHGQHSKSPLFAFGTALMSRYRFSTTYSQRFAPSFPTTRKGFVSVTFGDSTASGLAISFISVHLDFSRRSVRQAQVQELDEALAGLDHPFVLLGDFNSDWSQTDSVVRRLAERFTLKAHEPESDVFGTYVKSGRRLDWILISPGLEFDHYEVRPEVVSDHLAVVADISFTPFDKVVLQ